MLKSQRWRYKYKGSDSNVNFIYRYVGGNLFKYIITKKWDFDIGSELIGILSKYNVGNLFKSTIY